MCTGMEVMLIASAASSVMGGVAAKGAGKANKAIAFHNAGITRQNAASVRQKAQFDANTKRDKARRFVSDAGVKYLKGGVQMSGTPVEVLGDMAADFEFDVQTDIYGSELDAQAYENEAAMLEWQGEIAERRGKMAFKQGIVGAGVSLIGAGYSAGMFSGWGSSGAGGAATSLNGGGVSIYSPVKPSSYTPITY